MHFRAFVSAAVAATFVAGPLQAQSANTYEVVRLNDNAMTCEALVGEINSLSNEVRQQTANAARASRNRQTAGAVGRGLLSGLAQGASMLGVGGDGIGGAVAASAISGLANHAASAAATAPTEQPQAGTPSPRAERLAHLNNLNRNRSC